MLSKDEIIKNLDLQVKLLDETVSIQKRLNDIQEKEIENKNELIKKYEFVISLTKYKEDLDREYIKTLKLFHPFYLYL